MAVNYLESAVYAGLKQLAADRAAKPDKALTLREKQSRFLFMISLLILHARELGYELTSGELYDDDGTGHMPGSLHYIRLAGDLSLFINGKYKSDTESYRPLGQWWESIGGTWGGRFSDGNHFSFPHGGKK